MQLNTEDRWNGIPGAHRLSVGQPARRVAGLPLKRLVPQDVHSVIDYVHALLDLGAAFTATTTRARVACASLGASAVVAAALTDSKLALARLVPIERHEAFDYLWGASHLVVPLALGYAKKDRKIALLQLGIGLFHLVGALFTDYRAYEGIGRRID